LYATKQTCLLLKRHCEASKPRLEFSRDDWIAGLQVSVRARCVLRRAGFLLSRWCAGDQEQTAATINRFVPVVDAMFLESCGFRADLTAAALREKEHLLSTVPASKVDQGRAFFAPLIETVRQNPRMKLDLFYMLAAMGFPGGTDPIRWLEHLFEA